MSDEALSLCVKVSHRWFFCNTHKLAEDLKIVFLFLFLVKRGDRRNVRKGGGKKKKEGRLRLLLLRSLLAHLLISL